MKPRDIINKISSTIDLVQEDMEECKKNKDFEGFKLYLDTLSQLSKSLKLARQNVEKTINESK